MAENQGLLASILVLFAPSAVFIFCLKNVFSDSDFRKAGIAGVVFGMFAAILVKFIVFPLITVLFKIDIFGSLYEQNAYLKAIVCFLFVGPVEEGLKLIATFSAISLYSLEKRISSFFIASLACGIGFSLMENIDYLNFFGVKILFLRSIVSTTGHLIFSGISGIGISFSIYFGNVLGLGFLKSIGMLFSCFFLSAFFHGIFNFSLSSFDLFISTILSFYINTCLIFYLKMAWKKIQLLDLPLFPRFWFCSGCGLAGIGKELYCITCGDSLKYSIEVNPQKNHL
ncbi:MAG: PrsW family intramembrane metalloprotease [Candidatus Riflebacteria bacterium]|nr:PrsW family intramembrane metalloprotease [Candidatus Riflebacteria bacterium]